MRTCLMLSTALAILVTATPAVAQDAAKPANAASEPATTAREGSGAEANASTPQ